MNKYVITFSKQGYMKYISHLDLMRVFERGFKRTDIALAYSQGFNPHPKLVLAQPLSLGYLAENEILEIETKERFETSFVRETLSKNLPKGIEIKEVTLLEEQSKSLASRTIGAEYRIEIPINVTNMSSEETSEDRYEECSKAFLKQEQILETKKQKKTGKLLEINIRPMILDFTISFEKSENKLIITTTLAQGSKENLSPELLIRAFLEFLDLKCDRSEIEVIRKKLIFE